MRSYLAVLLYTSVALGAWKAEDETKDISTAFNPSSFNIRENWEICKRKIVRIPYVEMKKDYIPEFEAKFAQLKNGGSILLEKGVYKVSGPVIIPENCCILGAGMDTTTIQLNPDSLPLYNSEGMTSAAKGILSCSKNQRVSVIGLTVDGNIEEQFSGHKFFDFGRYGVSFERCNYAWLRSVRSKNNQLYGCK